MTTAFVLGGGGLLGAHEVGMLRALAEAGVRPDLVVGTSIGALNGVLVAADPDGAADRLSRMWQGEELRLAFSEKSWGAGGPAGAFGDPSALVRGLLRPRAGRGAPRSRFRRPQAAVPVRGGQHRGRQRPLVRNGPVVPAVMASCAVPGLLPPVEIDGAHYFDGGLVDSIPVGRAVMLGASTVYVLQVGRIESPLAVPTRPWEVGAGGVRDRPQAPVSRGDVVAAGECSGTCAADRRRPAPAGVETVPVPGQGQGGPEHRARVHGIRELSRGASQELGLCLPQKSTGSPRKPHPPGRISD